MRVFRAAAGFALAALFLLSAAGPVAGGSPEWTTEFRGSPARLGATSQGIVGGGELVVSLALGKSRAQPLFVDGMIYHAAGPYLRALDGGDLLAGRGGIFDRGDPEVPGSPWRRWFLGGVRVHPSDHAVPAATPTYDAARNVLYVANSCARSNLHLLVAVRADFYAPGRAAIIGQVALSADAVSSPLVLPGGEVILGTRDGYLWIIRGLADGSPRWTRQHAGGLVTSSPAPFSAHGFVLGRDAPGEVQAYYVRHVDSSGRQREDFELAWSLETPTGVPASFALHDGSLFFSDKSGVFYKARLATRHIEWQLDLSPEGLFVNNTPSVAGGTVYFAIRHGRDGRGKVIALDERTGDLRWRGFVPWQNPRDPAGNPLPMANTGTLVTGDGHVLLGDVIGRLIVFRTGAGPERRQGSVYRLHTDPSWVYLNPVFWESLQGISTEITAARGALLFGHVERLPGGGEQGFLNILRPGGPGAGTPDIEVSRLVRVPAGNVSPGQAVEYRATLVLRDARWPVTTAVFWRYAGDSSGTWRGWQEITLRSGEPLGVVFSLPAPETSRDLVFAANPHAVALELHEDPMAALQTVNLLPYYVVESRTDNNIRTLPVAVSAAPADLPNLRVRRIGTWGPYWADEWSEFAAWVELQGTSRVSAWVHARVWREGESRPDSASEIQVVVHEGDWGRNELRFDFHPGSREGRLVIEVEVNPAGRRTVEERTYDDNVLRVTVPVQRRPGPVVPGGVDPRIRVRLVR